MPQPEGSQRPEQGSGLWPHQHLHSQTGTTLANSWLTGPQGSMCTMSVPTLHHLAAARSGEPDGVTSAADPCKAGLAHVKQANLNSTYLTKQRVTWTPPLPPAATLLGAALARSAPPAQLQCLVTWQPAAPGSAAEVGLGSVVVQARRGRVPVHTSGLAQHTSACPPSNSGSRVGTLWYLYPSTLVSALSTSAAALHCSHAACIQHGSKMCSRQAGAAERSWQVLTSRVSFEDATALPSAISSCRNWRAAADASAVSLPLLLQAEAQSCQAVWDGRSFSFRHAAQQRLALLPPVIV